MKILLVWNLIPDSMEIYSLDVEEEQFARWSKVHGVYANSVHCFDEQETIIEEIRSLMEYRTPMFTDEQGHLSEIQCPILIQEHSAIIVTGFLY